MDLTLVIVTIIIQALAIVMVLYTFLQISQRNFPKLGALEEYHMMRNRYENLRRSLLFVGALIGVQLVGVFYYLETGTIPLVQLLISDIVVIALIMFLTTIYKGRKYLEDLELKHAEQVAEAKATDVAPPAEPRSVKGPVKEPKSAAQKKPRKKA